MNLDHYKRPEQRHSVARTATEAIIEDITNATNEKNKAKLMRALAITGNTLKWSDMQYLDLYRKRLDPKVKNYTALVWWHCKIVNKSTAQSAQA